MDRIREFFRKISDKTLTTSWFRAQALGDIMNFRIASQTIARITLSLAAALPAAAAALALLLLATSDGSAQGQDLKQDLKDKTIRIVVPFPPGGTADNIARLITQQANTAGFKLIVENRPGAGTIIATEQVARATRGAVIRRGRSCHNAAYCRRGAQA